MNRKAAIVQLLRRHRAGLERGSTFDATVEAPLSRRSCSFCEHDQPASWTGYDDRCRKAAACAFHRPRLRLLVMEYPRKKRVGA